MNTPKILTILGQDGFLDTSKPVNFGTNNSYKPGINNLSSNDVYDTLIPELTERLAQQNKKR